jgi:serine/threonine-protein kinase
MIFIGSAAMAQWAISSLGMTRLLFGITIPAGEIRSFLIGTAVAAAYALITIRLVRDRSMPVPQLRALEMVAVVLIVGFDVRDTVRYASEASPEVMKAGAVLPEAMTLTWVFHLMFYAVLIPNTASRAAIVVGAWVATALIAMLVAWSRLPLPPGVPFRWATTAMAHLIPTGGFAIFNSARISAYRRAAATARKVGNYLLVRKLGGGGMGDVFLARHRLLKRPCAVKLIRTERAGDATFAARFEREVAATTRLNHPCAVQVYDYGRTADGHFYYVMEYLPGLTLDEVVAADGPLPPGRAVHILRQVCGALRAAHLLGLVHRDIKPGNIMACRFEDRADVVKLLDFGLVFDAESAEDQRLTQVGGILGTPAYMSPEQARGEPGLEPASDLYSLGAVAYFLLTGRPPFQGRGGLEVLNAHLNAAVVPPTTTHPDIPPDLEAIVLKLLAKAPADRFPDAGALDRALASCGSPTPWTEADAADWWDRRPGRADADHSPPVATEATGITVGETEPRSVSPQTR